MPRKLILISTIRRKKCLTQRELAKKIGVSHSTISRIEKGEVIPKIDTVLALAHALEMDIEQIYYDKKGEAKTMEDYDETIRAAIKRMIKAIKEEDLKRIYDFVYKLYMKNNT
jgi:Predicted transcriptional regulators